MFRISALLGLAFLLVALVVGTTSSGEKKDKIKGTLPQGWGELNLSAEQKAKALSIRADFKAKIQDLEGKIKSLKKKETAELAKVLTAEQRELYIKLKLGEEAPKDKKDGSTDKEKNKDKDS